MTSKTRKTMAWSQIVLLVSFSFAITFLISESFGARVNAQVVANRGASLLTPTGPGTSIGVNQGGTIAGGIGDVPSLTSGAGANMPASLADAAVGGEGGGSNLLSRIWGGGKEGVTNWWGGKVDQFNAFQAGRSSLQTQVTGLQTSVAELEASGTATAAELETAKSALAAKEAELAKLAGGDPSNTATATSGKGTLGGVFSGQLFGIESGGAIAGGAIVSGLLWGAIVGGAAYGLAKMFGATAKQAASIGMGLGAGTFVGSTLYLAGQNVIASQAGSFAQISSAAQLSGGYAFLTPAFALFAGIAVAAVIIIFTYTKEKKELVHFECYAWEAPTGGSQCESCNEDPMMPCSEYRCKSLGQACEIVNPGTEEEMCVWVGKGDTAAPHIVPWDEPLPDGLKYIPDTAISPPNRGFKIVDSEGDDCLKAFSDLEFGVIADEPAQCRIAYEPAENYDLMSPMGGSTLFVEEHSQRLKVPNPFAEDAQGNGTDFEIHNDGTYTLWVRCIDANGNGRDSALVAFRFCVDPSPDLEAPVIEGTSIRTGEPVQFGVDSFPIEVYLNEPAQCKWSRQDKAYQDMENEMSCSTASYQINYNLDYTCTSELTGIEDRTENWFYFRCEDMSTAEGGHNVMEVSYPLMLQGTQELVIKEVGPTGEIKGSTTTIPVTLTAETMAGAREGKATCRISTSSDSGFVVMENTGETYLHNQTLDLIGGYYQYFFECFDNGGNLDYANTTFHVDIDTGTPKITRVFRDTTVLKVITDEDAKCYYSQANCDFAVEDSSPMLYADATKRNIHTVEWNEDVTYYIKCEDFQGNQPSPDQCQIVVKASEL